ncbi:hypothetical protein L209DRAFT_437048 [Thermothelomyces heterothallicus CBS 203.75]
MGIRLDASASVYVISGRLASGIPGARVCLWAVSSRDGRDDGGCTGHPGRLPRRAPSGSGCGGVRDRGVGSLDGPGVAERAGREGSHRIGEPGASSYTDTIESCPGGRPELSESEETSERTVDRRAISGEQVAITGDNFCDLIAPDCRKGQFQDALPRGSGAREGWQMTKSKYLQRVYMLRIKRLPAVLQMLGMMEWICWQIHARL